MSEPERLVLSDAIRCEWCGAEPGERCHDGRSWLGYVHLVRAVPPAVHEEWVTGGHSAYGVPR
jgi:hypothetical protein